MGKLKETYGCVIIQNNFEFPYYRLLGNMDAVNPNGKVAFVNRLNALFAEYAAANENFYLQDIQYLSACYGLDKWGDSFTGICTNMRYAYLPSPHFPTIWQIL